MKARNNRILLVDDSRAIHEDYQKIFVGFPCDQSVLEAEAMLFNQQPEAIPVFDLTSVFQGEEAIAAIEKAKANGLPFAMAFIDVRMPPGIDGIATAARLWQIDPDLQVVICTAYSDHSWSDMRAQLTPADRWVLLRKPFDNVEVLQLANALTEKWHLRQQSNSQLAELEIRVAARTSELRQALEELKRESEERARIEEERRTFQRKFEETQRLESLGVLAGGIAHDFNNILTGILGSASLAKLEIAPGSALDEHLGRIEKGSCRAAELCEQMLAYAGKGQIALRHLDMNTLINETLELLHASVPKDARLHIELTSDLPPILGDPGRMRQVIMNLVINAAESLGPQPRRVTLASRVAAVTQEQLAAMTFPGDAAGGSYVCVEITDTGSGMTPETVRRIFEPFFTTKFTGRGLGLCAVQGIIRSRGGALDVRTSVGVGSSFRAYFPALSSSNHAAPTLPVTPVSESVANRTILIIDDEPSVRQVAAVALRRQGYHVLSARTGAEAVDLIQHSSQAIDGVLLDLTMPDLDGVSTLEALRTLRPGLRAVLMSGFDQREATRHFEGMALTAFLQKPFTLELLREKIALVLPPASVGCPRHAD